MFSFLKRKPDPRFRAAVAQLEAKVNKLNEEERMIRAGERCLSLQLGQYGIPTILIQLDGAGGCIVELKDHPEAGHIAYAGPRKGM